MQIQQSPYKTFILDQAISGEYCKNWQKFGEEKESKNKKFINFGKDSTIKANNVFTLATHNCFKFHKQTFLLC